MSAKFREIDLKSNTQTQHRYMPLLASVIWLFGAINTLTSNFNANEYGDLILKLALLVVNTPFQNHHCW